MNKKKKTTIFQIMDGLTGLWILYRTGLLDKLIELAKAVEESSNKNTSNSAPTAKKSVRKTRKKKKS